jgi:hypothetical protein
MTYPWRLPHRLLCAYDLNFVHKNSDLLLLFDELLHGLSFQPNHLSFGVAGKPLPRRHKLKDYTAAVDHLSKENLPIEWVSVEKEYEKNSSQITGRMYIYPKRKMISISDMQSEFSLDHANALFQTFLKYNIPSYAFIHSMNGGLSAAFWVTGTRAVQLGCDHPDENEENSLLDQRADSLGDGIGRLQLHLNRMHDVYEVNFLTQRHLSQIVFGTTLHNWIVEGKRGQLIEVGIDTFSWSVPETIRPAVREQLFRSGYLFATA